MAKDRVYVKIQSTQDNEELFFKEQEQKLIRELGEKAAKESDQKYREDHDYHCFRCGTKSLVEVDRGDIKVDICVNENCGAVHLDPGELEEILKDKATIIRMRKSIMAIFK
ncbi:zf-TFIIB domain-containing protein [Thermodesulfobacteriota bacterium]